MEDLCLICQVRHHGKEYAVGPHQGHLSLSRLNIEQQMEQLDSLSAGFRTAAICCVVLSSAFVGGLIGYRLFKAWKRRKDRSSIFTSGICDMLAATPALESVPALSLSHVHAIPDLSHLLLRR